MHPAVLDRLARLSPDQRAAAAAPPGPVLCVAPAGSGKTTTLVARIAWLMDGGAAPEAICAVTFNRRAAGELRGCGGGAGRAPRHAAHHGRLDPSADAGGLRLGRRARGVSALIVLRRGGR